MSKIFKKVVAMLAVSAVAAFTTFAASADESTVKLNLSGDVKGNPGESVFVDVYVSGAALEYDSLGLMIEYDKDLTLQSVGSDYGDMNFGVASRDNSSYCLVYDFMGSAFSYEVGETLFTFEFKIPENAEKNHKYQVKWAQTDTFAPVLSNTELDEEEISFELSNASDAITCVGGDTAEETVTEAAVNDAPAPEAGKEQKPPAPDAGKVQEPPAPVKKYDTVEKLVKVTRREQQIREIKKDSNYSKFLDQYYEQQQILQNSVAKIG